MTEPLYDVDGDRYLPTAHTRGPWDSGAQHGGPVAALLARAIESLPSDAPMRVARLTVELLRPVPLTPSTVSAQIERGGRRVQLVSASLAGPGGELCRATAWRIRELPEPMEKNLYHLSAEERRRVGVEQLPESLGEAIEITAQSELVLRALGEHMFNRYVEIKRQEWDDYRVQVTRWELERYLSIL